MLTVKKLLMLFASMTATAAMANTPLPYVVDVTSSSSSPSFIPSSQNSDSSLLSRAEPFGQENFDTPLIRPSNFARQHDLISSPAYVKSLCHLPGLHCVVVKPNDTWARIFPNFIERHTIMRLNRMNVALAYRHWLLVPKAWNNLNDWALSPMPLHRNTHGRKLLVVDLKKFAFGAYDKHGKLVRWGPATGGKKWDPMLGRSCLTKAGRHRIYLKKGPKCFSSKYPIVTKGGAPMPYCMFYYKGYAIHASTLSGFLDRSRGCIRLFFDDAKWLSTKFSRVGTKVVVIR